MYKTVLNLILPLVCVTSLFGQITVDLSTLPNIGDQLVYLTIPADTTGSKIDDQVFQKGDNLQWDFSNLSDTIEFIESYTAVTPGTVADSFPDADLSIDFLGLKGFAKRNTTDISILGVAGDSIAGFNIPIVAQLESPFTIRRAPFGYEDQFGTSSSFVTTLEASVLDSVPEFQELLSVLPGTTIDSLRIRVSIDRTEDIDGWGMITVPSGLVPVLKGTQDNIISISLEVYAVTFSGEAWVDLRPFLPEDIRNALTINAQSHLFYSADKKEIVAEFSMASDSTLLSTRYAKDVKSGLFDYKKYENKVDVLIFPNPSSDWVEINIIDEINSNNLIVEIHGTNGQLNFRKELMNLNNKINISSFNSGVHIISIRSKGELISRSKLLVARSN